MSWLYSRALVEEYSEENSLDGEQSAQLNAKPTPQAYLYKDKTTEFWSRFPSGITLQPLTANRGRDLLTWFLEGFPVKTSAQPEKEQESREVAPVCGRKWQELSVKYDRDSYSWKTHRCLFQEVLKPFSVTLPRWGMMRSGVLYQHLTSERPIKENESGFVPTPTVSDTTAGESRMNGDYKKYRGIDLATYARKWPTPRAGNPGSRKPGTGGKVLAEEVKKWPTPVKYDATPGGPNNHCNGLGKMAKTGKLETGNNGGQLNPKWVEWLMGWPLGWTDLKPLAMDKYQEWLQQHGSF